MNTLEQVKQGFVDAIAAQWAAFDVLEHHAMDAEQLWQILDLTRELERLAQLTTLYALRELVNEREVFPRTAGGSNKLRHVGRFSRAELRNYLRIAEDVFEKPPFLGSPDTSPAAHPHTAQGMREGLFGVESAVEISKTMAALPDDITAEVRAHVEAMMAGFATELAPDDLRSAGQKILQGLAADSEPADDNRRKLRDATLSRQGADLMSSLYVTATPELHALLSRLFADYAGPGDLLPAGEKDHDDRFAGQRRHDALVAALKCALGPGGAMTPTRGCSTVVATMSIEQLAHAAGPVATDVGTLLPIPDLIRLGADKNAFLALLEEGTGNLIELGKFKRTADLHAYLGLVAAQGGDMTPGSHLPAAMCEIHHICAWRYGGRSTGDNLTFIGHATHRNTDDAQEDPDKWWTYCSKTGHLLWRPPKHIDPHRTPRINISPHTWFNPGQMMRLFGAAPPGTTCQHCAQAA